jgi:hypothetical protein
MPRRASLSSSGVLHCGCPNPLNAVFKSSDIKNKTFGLDGFAKIENAENKEKEIRKEKLFMKRISEPTS